ncbi:hypothetical protein QC761_505170 [Podospora bellae-mahoneyi]|uniref:Uncharacterized protein n=1 Tax=Podospora bellae-mahoneyi TaxID=2093777 RepID=A0ABR0FE36_9PEZI|nr:hypothetical protein QC761_505170 [Podospora bellae-mahoneyi]
MGVSTLEADSTRAGKIRALCSCTVITKLETFGWKADGEPGWAFHFCTAEFFTFVLYRPFHACGYPEQPAGHESFGCVTKTLSKDELQRYYTAPRSQSHEVYWPSVQSHCMWDGTGELGDPIFERTYARMVPEYLDPQEQQ